MEPNRNTQALFTPVNVDQSGIAAAVAAVERQRGVHIDALVAEALIAAYIGHVQGID